jgi:hypothetical protein
MNIKTTRKPSAITCIICGLTLLPLTLTAQNKVVGFFGSATESGTSYQGVANDAALRLEGFATYSGTDITLSNTFNSDGNSSVGTGVWLEMLSKLTLIDSTITTSGNYGHGIRNIGQGSSTDGITLNNVKIKTTGDYAYGIHASFSITLKLTNTDITATGNGAYGIYLDDNSKATVDLNGNTLTGGIYVGTSSSNLTLTGSNGSIIAGDIITYGGYANLTLSGSDTQLIGAAIQQTNNTITLKIENGTRLNQFTGNITTLTLQNGATLGTDNNGLLLNGAPITVTTDLLTLSNGAIIDYNGTPPLTLTGNLAIGNGILIDFSNLTETGLYTILDWSTASVTGDITDAQFNIATTGVEGAFTVNTENKQLTFNATAIPEPSTWFLLGTGLALLLLTARRNARS